MTCDRVLLACSWCGKVKSLEEFRYIEEIGYYWYTCKRCECDEVVEEDAFEKMSRTEYEKQDHVRELRQGRDKRVVTLHDALWEEQDGVCPICGDRPQTKSELVIDHDHSTGKVRGLLCKGCNTWIGKNNEDIDRFQAAADYLRRHKKKDCIG